LGVKLLNGHKVLVITYLHLLLLTFAGRRGYVILSKLPRCRDY
jgi:hypothetical protein